MESLVTFLEDRDIEVNLLSEYGITPVKQPIHINRIFREKGWLTIKDEMGLEILDAGASQAFAVADHQVAHVYVRDSQDLDQVLQCCREIPGVDSVLHGESRTAAGLDHSRAGDLVLVSDATSWFTYYYWQDDAHAPDFARCVDIHRKPGYDPVELFLDPNKRLPKVTIARKLLQKKLGFRMLMDLIPLDATLVKGSHGRMPEDQLDWPILLGPAAPKDRQSVSPYDVHDLLKQATE